MKLEHINPEKNYVFHYLDANALINIVQNKKLWATNIAYMNDDREGKVAQSFIEEALRRGNCGGKVINNDAKWILERFLASTRFAFSTSFSERYDNLSMYRTYAPASGGYCIGFDEEYLKSIASVQYVKCSYDKQLQEQTVADFIITIIDHADNIISQYPDINQRANVLIGKYHNCLEDMSISFKTPEFVTEEESRIFVTGKPWDERKLRVSSKGNIILPYVEIDLPDVNTDIVLCRGPNESGELADKGLTELYHIAKASDSKWNIHKLNPMETGYRNV